MYSGLVKQPMNSTISQLAPALREIKHPPQRLLESPVVSHLTLMVVVDDY